MDSAASRSLLASVDATAAASAVGGGGGSAAAVRQTAVTVKANHTASRCGQAHILCFAVKKVMENMESIPLSSLQK